MKTLTAILLATSFIWLFAVKAADITITVTVPNKVINAVKTGLVVRTGNTNIFTMSNASLLSTYVLPELGNNNTNWFRGVIKDAGEYERIYNTNDLFTAEN